MICSMKYDASVDLWSVGVILYGKSHRRELCMTDSGREERMIVRSLSAKYRPDRYRRDKSVKFGTELP